MTVSVFPGGPGTRATLPDCERPRCPGKVLDHICVVCGCSDLPGLDTPVDWLYELPTQLFAARGDVLDGPGARPGPATSPEHAPRARQDDRPEWPEHDDPAESAPARHAEPPARRASRRPGRERPTRLPLPAAPKRDPRAAIMKNPVVAEQGRFCAGCFEPVGRGDGTRPGSAQGRCARCGSSFSFVPRLRRGEVVGARYEVFGCLSHGGQGWIHLAKDHREHGRWVVLKGIIHVEDPGAAATAVAEQRFLAEVEHPNIVQIIDFVWHEQASTNYLVMEYLGGPTLRDMAFHHYHTYGTTLPAEYVVAYGLEILRAFAYLHSTGLLYCDLKPSNVIQADDRVKLIDLGGMRRQGDMKSPLIHTAGFAAPELGERGATVASDLYSVGRTLEALAAPADGSEPSQAEPEFQRVLRWATDPDPDRRPSSSDELAEHLAAAIGA
ncbi:MAG TPA: serine/threonine protein kinase [Actinophytocola sp.]|jgi:serine/threonine-protein kinase PknG|nr:serine/threonine protein kinase [Actinophytocola sp.]